MSYFPELSNPPDTLISGIITALDQTVTVILAGHKSCSVTVAGTWTGTLIVESSTDNGTVWVRCWLQNIAVANSYEILRAVNSFNSNGAWAIYNTSGITHYRVKAITAITGTANIQLTATEVAPGALFASTSVIQNVLVSTVNSSVVNLAKSPDSGYSFTGTADSTLGVAGIQVTLKTDQNCLVYIEQSPDGLTGHWDISDVYEYRCIVNPNFGITVQAVNSYVRIRVENQSLTTATTYFRLQTCLCPIVETLPRSLCEKGLLQTGIHEITDGMDNIVKVSPEGAIKTTNVVKLCGVGFRGTTIDTNFWTSAVANGGTGVQTGGQFELRTNTTANGNSSLQSVRIGRYVIGSPNYCRMLVDYGTTPLNNTKRWGVFTGTINAPTDGAMFEIINGIPTLAVYKAGTPNRISNGSFNGDYGVRLDSIPSGAQEFEIIYNNKFIWFMFNGKLAHKIIADSDTWTNTQSLPLRAENINTGSSIIDTSLKIRSFSIYRYGESLTKPAWKYQPGNVTAVILKRGPGTLQKIINGDNVGALILYDDLVGTNIIASIDLARVIGDTVFDLDFYTGLCYTTTGGPKVTIVYE